jgi:hypothetical protein
MAETETKEPTTTEDTEAGDLAPETEERIVDKVVNRVRDVVDAAIAAAKGTTTEVETETGETETGAKVTETARTQEIDMEALVRAEVAKILPTGKEAEPVVQEVKKELERAPVQMRRDTKFLWGEK